MFLTSAINAYHESLLSNAVWKAEAGLGSRNIPIVGGFLSNLGAVGNVLYRPFKIAGAFVFGHDKPQAPAMPELPEKFKGTELGENLKKAFDSRVEAAGASAESLGKLASLDITGYQQSQSIAAHEAARVKVHLPEEGAQEVSSAAIRLGSMALGMGALAVFNPASFDLMRSAVPNIPRVLSEKFLSKQ